MNPVILFGAPYSVYVRIVRLVLEEIGAPYELVEIDIFSKEAVPADYAERHPFGRIPALEHDGFRLFETDAIVGYVIESFGGGALLPQGVRERARMRQIMRIMDNYGYPSWVWGIFVEEMERGRPGALTPEELERGTKCLRVLDELAAGEHLVGAALSLADLWTYPMVAYLDLAPSGRKMLAGFPKLYAWFERMGARPSVAATRFRAERKAI
jgi:glutathione S-transferase